MRMSGPSVDSTPPIYPSTVARREIKSSSERSGLVTIAICKDAWNRPQAPVMLVTTGHAAPRT
jgi:hypothetical protein